MDSNEIISTNDLITENGEGITIWGYSSYAFRHMYVGKSDISCLWLIGLLFMYAHRSEPDIFNTLIIKTERLL